MSHVPHIIGADPLCFPLDVFRVSVAAVIAKALHIPVETAFSGVDLGKKGVDFTVALPRFRLKNKPVELAERVLSTVRCLLFNASSVFTQI
jgi:arginyl-tRNA synthetase